MRFVTSDELRQRLSTVEELALLDLREEGAFADGHLLVASCVPLSRLEMLIADLIPRQGTPVILCGSSELAERGAEKLSELGYKNVLIYPGGPADWQKGGFGVFNGVHVPSKAFGESVQRVFGTPQIGPEDLKARLDAGEDVMILDSRPLEEYRARRIPGAVNVPGVELVYRIKDLAPSEETLLVVNCGGRTRSIIGAQLLINADVANRVVALENGTMGWHLAGLPLEHGQSRRAPTGNPRSLAWSRQIAARLAQRFGVRSIDLLTLAHWTADEHRTLYIFDVRQPEEYAAGHLPNARNVAGGQLIQETDRYIAIRSGRIVLSDDTGVRAVATAAWLKQMGYANVSIVKELSPSTPLATGGWHPTVLGTPSVPPREIRAEDMLSGSLHSFSIIDLATSPNYKRGHIPGAHFAIRAQMRSALASIELSGEIVLTSEDGILARLASAEVSLLSGREVRVLVGGTAAWCAAGGELEFGTERWAVPPRDVWVKPFEQMQGRLEDRLDDYLQWEINLLEQVSQDGTLSFPLIQEMPRSVSTLR